MGPKHQELLSQLSMKTFAILVAALTASATAQLFPPSPSGCPAAPEVDTANGVPIKPENVPAGCSDFEVLVGKPNPYHHDTLSRR